LLAERSAETADLRVCYFILKAELAMTWRKSLPWQIKHRGWRMGSLR
jgi:hypothetical protein